MQIKFILLIEIFICLCFGSLLALLGNEPLAIWIGLEAINFIGISGLMLIGILYEDYSWIKIALLMQLFSLMIALRYNEYSEAALRKFINNGSGEINDEDNSG